MKFKIGRFDKSIPLFHEWHVERPRLILDFRFEVNDCLFRVASDEHTDGESTPDMFNVITGDSFYWRNLGPANIHDASCSGDLQVFGLDGWSPVYLSQSETGAIFRDYSITWNRRPPKEDRSFWSAALAESRAFLRRSLIYAKWAIVTPAVFVTSKHISFEDWRKRFPNGIVFSVESRKLVKYNPLSELRKSTHAK